eukprot:CAMPEP_0118987010 /NCGR_PEP_ID=MMETSP1173-20130426/43308_1 /TAXON_ID=1034831 /ORGANISM="Rhizochromulina marina cf, Strain CCMP1243" /LENGTH=95 /DNA_ID=CAMNT_0006937827 /DNA_START=1 /DNA_END=284 /DNA_ORIENTATION=-
MLHGQKRLVLASPRHWRRLYMYSSLHPASRQSQVPVEAGRAEVERLGFAEFPWTDLTIATLEPGQALYLPPFHFHSVEVVGTEFAVSTNAYLDAP